MVGILSTKDKVEQFKRELRSYKYYKNSIEELERKLEEVGNQLLGVSSPRIKEVVAGAVSAKYPTDNKVELIMKEESLKIERDYYLHRINTIDKQLASLNEADSKLLTDIYIKRIPYEVEAYEEHYSVDQMKRRANKIIKSII